MGGTIHQLPRKRLSAGAVVRYRGQGPNLLVAHDMGAITAVIACTAEGVGGLEIQSFPTNELVQVLSRND
jgi:hypothetical protein